MALSDRLVDVTAKARALCVRARDWGEIRGRLEQRLAASGLCLCPEGQGYDVASLRRIFLHTFRTLSAELGCREGTCFNTNEIHAVSSSRESLQERENQGETVIE